MNLVDLHVHTICSDGHDTPEAVVKMAAANEVAVIAVADHDNLGGLKRAEAAGQASGVKVVRGVEITTGFHGRIIHLLGLGLPQETGNFKFFLEKISKNRRQGVIGLIKQISDQYVAASRAPVDLADFEKSMGDYFGTEKAAEYLVAKGFEKEIEPTVKKLFALKDGGTRPAIPTETAIAAVHAAGAVAILSHPFALGASLKKIAAGSEEQEDLLKELVGFGLDGLECYQSEHSSEDTAFALSLAGKYGLLVSAGSDWHGAVCDVGDMKDRKGFYPEHIGGLNVTMFQVAPLLERLGIVVDKC